jgi:hypothetical protein
MKATRDGAVTPTLFAFGMQAELLRQIGRQQHFDSIDRDLVRNKRQKALASFDPHIQIGAFITHEPALRVPLIAKLLNQRRRGVEMKLQSIAKDFRHCALWQSQRAARIHLCYKVHTGTRWLSSIQRDVWIAATHLEAVEPFLDRSAATTVRPVGKRPP